jgi:hypothetical protein
MLAATGIAIFLIPVLFFIVEKLGHKKDGGKDTPSQVPEDGGTGGAA